MPPQIDGKAHKADPRSSCAALYAHKMRRYRERDGLGQERVTVDELARELED